MAHITKIKLHNFKRFQKFEVEFHETINLLIGDNEAGKSSVLTAIDLVVSGSTHKVQTLGLESLFNIEAISEFFTGEKTIDRLPKLFIEIYLNDSGNPDLNGKNNSSGIPSDGLRLVCEPREDLSKEIKDVLEQGRDNFPFEFYSIKFSTFADLSYTGYRKFLRHLLLDSTQINNEYANKEYIKAVYHSHANDTLISKQQNEYRRHKGDFRDKVLNELNDKMDDYQFSIRTGSKANLETDLTITEDSIPLEDRGKGRQCFIKTEFALQKKQDGGKEIDVMLLEEPENHLSHSNMQRLIHSISSSDNKQLFISTHNNMICSRLNLRNAIFLNSNGVEPAKLSQLNTSTAKFFMKAPDNNVLELILSRKVLLVEGDAEYILMDEFFKKTTAVELKDSDVHIIAVGGTSFKRYIELAALLGIKVASITDNDGSTKDCAERYKDHISDIAAMFCDPDDGRSTFEIALYQDNKYSCDDLFGERLQKNSVQEYMLKNKTDVAFKLLDKKADDLIVPKYIQEAIEWING